MKNNLLILAAVTFILPTVSLAATSPCGLQISSQQTDFSSSTDLQCLAKEDNYNEAISSLCTENQISFSPMYKAYLSYDAQKQELMKALEAHWNDDQKNSLLLDLQNLDSQWKVLGFKNEVDALLFNLGGAIRNCK